MSRGHPCERGLERMSRNPEIVERVAVGDAELRMWAVGPVREVYDGPVVNEPRSWVEFVGPGGLSEIKTMEDFCTAVRSVAPRLGNEELEAIARIAREMAGTGRVVTAHPLYSFVEERFEVELTKNIPRIESDRLRFLAIQSDLSRGLYGLEEVDVELATGRVARRNIAPRQARDP